MRPAICSGVERAEDSEIELREKFGAHDGVAVGETSFRDTDDESLRDDSGKPASRLCALWSNSEVDCTGTVSVALVWTKVVGTIDVSPSSRLGGRWSGSCLLCNAFLLIVNGIVFEVVFPFEAHCSGVENSTCCPKKVSMSSNISTAGVTYAMSVPR